MFASNTSEFPRDFEYCYELIEEFALSERKRAIRECADACDLEEIKQPSDLWDRGFNNSRVICRDKILKLLQEDSKEKI